MEGGGVKGDRGGRWKNTSYDSYVLWWQAIWMV